MRSSRQSGWMKRCMGLAAVKALCWTSPPLQCGLDPSWRVSLHTGHTPSCRERLTPQPGNGPAGGFCHFMNLSVLRGSVACSAAFLINQHHVIMSKQNFTIHTRIIMVNNQQINEARTSRPNNLSPLSCGLASTKLRGKWIFSC